MSRCAPGWGRERHQSPECQTWRKRTQDQADSEQMDVADGHLERWGLGVGLRRWLLSVGWEWIASMVSVSLRLLSRAKGDGSGD